MFTVVKNKRARVDTLARKAMDSLILPAMLVQLDGKLLYLNEAAKDVISNFIGHSSMTLHAWSKEEEPANEWVNHFSRAIATGITQTWTTQLGDGKAQELTWFKIVFNPVLTWNNRVEFVSVSFSNVDSEIKGRLKLAEEVDWLRDVLSQLKTKIFVSVLCAILGGTSWLVLKPYVENVLSRWIDYYIGS